MGIDKQFSEASDKLGRKNSATNVQSALTSANSCAFGTMKKAMTPSFDNCLGLSAQSSCSFGSNSCHQESEEQHSQVLSPTENKRAKEEERERKRDRKSGYKQVYYIKLLDMIMD